MADLEEKYGERERADAAAAAEFLDASPAVRKSVSGELSSLSGEMCVRSS